MNENKKSYFASIVLFLIIILFVAYLQTQNSANTKNIQTLEGNWEFLINNKQVKDNPGNTLASFIFPEVQVGDVVTLSRPFTHEKLMNPLITFDTWHTITKVYLDNEQIYQWGEEYHQKGQMLGAARHSVALPQEYMGKMLTIELTATESNPIPYLTSVAYYPAGESAAIWFNRPLSLLLIGTSSIIVGVLILAISCVFFANDIHFLEPFSLGLSILLTGIYILSRGNFIQLVIHSPLIYNAIEYISLFTIPIAILLYWYHEATVCDSRILKIIYFTLLNILIIFVVGSLIANFVTTVHLCQLLPAYYLIVFFVAIVAFLIIKLRDKTNNYLRKRIQGMGIGAFIVGSVLSIAAFQLCYNDYIATNLHLWKWYNNILPFAMCVLVMFFLLSFYLDIKQIISSSYRNEFLEYIAYFDALTQLYNRRSFNEDMETLVLSENYGIISIDLNGLKMVNDTAGHSEGDAMLQAFADLINKFSDNNIKTYRLGGDEFAIIVQNNDDTFCFELINRLQNDIHCFNNDKHTFILSAACGIAFCHETDTPTQVFELADKRMYDNKQDMKASEKSY